MHYSFTVADMKSLLAQFPDDYELKFEGGLSISRLKQRGDELVVAEFNQWQAMLSKRFKRKFPEVLVAFCDTESDGELVQEVIVPEL